MRILLVTLLAVSACSAGSSAKQSLDVPVPTGPPSATTAAAAQASKQPTAVGSTAPTVTSGPTASSAATFTPVAPLATRAPGTIAAQKATAPGVYTSDESGTVTLGSPGTPQDASGTTTLTVAPLKNGVQHSSLHSDNTGDTDEDILVRSTGSYIAALKLTSPAFTKEFRPSPAVLLVPDPAKVGSTWTWGGTSTDGKTKAATTNKIGSSQTLTIGGTKVVCAVVQTHLVLSGDIDYTTDLTTYWSPAFHLPVKTHSVGKGAYNGFPFTTDITSVMRSVKPA